MSTVLVVGAGGHARVVIDALCARGGHSIAGVIDVPGHVGGSVAGFPVIGADADLARLAAEGAELCVIAIGSVGDPSVRIRVAAEAQAAGLGLLTVVHPSASVSAGATLGDGTFVGPAAVVGVGARLGVCAIVNSGAVVDHDCVIGDFAHVAPGAVLSGDVTVGDGAHIGSGTAVRQGVRIGANTVVGVGSAVVADLPAGVVAFGNPCRVVSEGVR